MANVIESGIGSLNFGKQATKGTIATAATTTVGWNKPKWFDGMLGAKSTLGSEEFVDGLRFGSPANYVDTIGGAIGTITIQSQAENVGLYMSQMLGTDVVTGAGDPFTHTITSSTTVGGWGTWWQKVGSTVGPNREVYYDSKLSKLVMSVSDKQNAMHYAMDLMSVNPAEVFTADPAKTEDATDPYYFTESEGAITFDGTVLSEINEEMLEIDTGMKPYYGNAAIAVQLIESKGTIVRTLKTIVTDETLKKYKKAIYGEESPAAGKKPVAKVFFAAVKSVYKKSGTRKVTFETPKVAIKPDEMAIGANREGGEIPISFGGDCLKEGATAALTVIAESGDATTYV